MITPSTISNTTTGTLSDRVCAESSGASNAASVTNSIGGRSHISRGRSPNRKGPSMRRPRRECWPASGRSGNETRVGEQAATKSPLGNVRLLYLLLFVSGATALTYQALWVRQLGLVVGVELQATTLAVSGFFAGLAVGNSV